MVFAWQEHKDITGDDQQKSQGQDLCAPKGWAIENTGKFTKLNQTQLLIAHNSLIPYPASLCLSAPVLLMKQLRRREKKKASPQLLCWIQLSFSAGLKGNISCGFCLFISLSCFK